MTICKHSGNLISKLHHGFLRLNIYENLDEQFLVTGDTIPFFSITTELIPIMGPEVGGGRLF